VVGYTTMGLDGNALTGTYDAFITMYNSAGEKVRTKQLGVAGTATAATGVAVDSSDNVYVTGVTYGGLDGNVLTGASDFFLVKYDSSGSKVGNVKQMGTASAGTLASGVAVDSSNNVYVAGYTNGGLDGNSLTGRTDFFLVKYDSSGNKVGSAKQMGVAGAATYSYGGVAVDSSGNVYVAGTTNGGLDGNTLTGVFDFFLVKYDSSGNKMGTAKQMGVAGRSTHGYAVKVDANDNVYVAGPTSGGLDGNSLTGTADFFLVKYDSSGNKVGTAKQMGAVGAITEADGIAVDSSGNVYVAGYTTGGLDGNALTEALNFFLVKYDSSGNKVGMAKQLGVASTTFSAKGGVAVDSSNNVYVTGDTTDGLDGNTLIGTTDFFLMKYDSSGNKQWLSE
jgi:hypothetical protein